MYIYAYIYLCIQLFHSVQTTRINYRKKIRYYPNSRTVTCECHTIIIITPIIDDMIYILNVTSYRYTYITIAYHILICIYINMYPSYRRVQHNQRQVRFACFFIARLSIIAQLAPCTFTITM